MGTKISIRPATARDATGAAEVFLAARATMTYLPRLHSDAETRAYIGRIVSEQEMLIAREEACVRGFAVLRERWLDHLYVHPSHLGRGIGTALLRRIQKQRPDGFAFWVFQQNLGARRFYERHGCRAVEFTDGSGNEEKLPDVRYSWGPQEITTPQTHGIRQ